MSRRREVRVITWTDEHGQRHEHRTTVKQEPSLAASVPRRLWLVEVYDPARHLVAVLAANAGLEPLVYSGGTWAPSFVLSPDGLRAARVVNDEREPRPTVTGLGAPRPAFPVWCATCRADYPVGADDLTAMRGEKPGKPRRLTIGVSHSADGAQR